MNAMKLSPGERVFSACNYFLLSVVSLLAVYPFVYVLSASLSSPAAVVTGEVILLPKELTWRAYETVLSRGGIWTAYVNTIYYTVLGTAVSMALTICGAYPLSKRRLVGGTVVSFIIAVTLWINMSGSAGMIPFYLNLRELGLINSRFGILIAFAVTTFYVFLLRTFFQQVPGELEEAAKMDGAGDWAILLRVYLPLSVPALMTVGLFYAIQRWNGYFWAMILLTDERKVPLQVLLKKMIVEMNMGDMLSTADVLADASKETLIYATIIVSIVPIVAVYPYIQSYFVKGIMIGSIKE